MNRRSRTFAACFLAALAASSTTATAQVPRDDSMTEPVYLVHGYGSGTNCVSKWRTAVKVWRSKGWTGAFHRVGYYSGDERCNTSLGSNTQNTSIVELGRRLAWKIHRRYSLKGTSVDVVGHSMGGLIARVALAGTQNGASGFPPYLYVEDAITVGTPHRGVTASSVQRCPTYQCRQMRPGSRFLRMLAQQRNHAPQSAQGTDWTLIGAADDDTVAPASATGMDAPHRIVFHRGQGVTHSRLLTLWRRDRSYNLSYRNRGDSRGWRETTRGRSPVIAIGGGIRRARDW